MKKNILKYLCLLVLGMSMLTTGCKKQDEFLNVKRLQQDVDPKTIPDFQAILDFNDIINNHFTTLGLVGTDNLFITDTNYPSVLQDERDAYVWNPAIWDDQGGVSYDWNYLYTIIESANIVLDGLQNVESSSPGYNNVKGQALFFRAICFYTLAQLFCKPYDVATANTDLGLPLRTSSDVSIIFQRSTLQKTYDQIINDTQQAATLLDVNPLYITRPSKNAAWALLSKTYLVMGDFNSAGLFANKVLSDFSSLIDFNSNLVSISTTYRFPANGIGNPEVMFFASSINYTTVRPYSRTKGRVDTLLYSSYDNNDLRKTVFYKPNGGYQQFIGGYAGASFSFCGLATNEQYLIRAECDARKGDISGAMADLNALLKKRYRTGTFTPLTAPDQNAALNLVLQERRKELPFTANIRWEDLRRLNKEPGHQVTVTRIISGTTYTLPPNDHRYTFPIPADEIQQSGIQQNGQ